MIVQIAEHNAGGYELGLVTRSHQKPPEVLHVQSAVLGARLDAKMKEAASLSSRFTQACKQPAAV